MKDGLIDRAVSYIQCTEFSFSKNALNIGPRNLEEPEYLSAEYGFVVDAVDKGTLGTSQNSNINVYQLLIEDFNFTNKTYHFVLAKNIFYFIPKIELLSLFEQLKSSMNTGAVIYFTVLGEYDAWISEKSFDYFTQSEIADIFKDYECMNMIEKRGWGSTYSKNEKYWHTLTFIYRK